MSKLIILSVLALSFTTGFTCSKNAPQQTAAPEVQAPAQAEMTAPVSMDSTAASSDVKPATPTETK